MDNDNVKEKYLVRVKDGCFKSNADNSSKNSGRFESFVVATLTMITSAAYLIRFHLWNLEPTDEYSVRCPEYNSLIHRIYHYVVITVSLGNSLVIISSLLVYYVVWPKEMQAMRRRRNALIPFFFVQMFFLATATHRILLTFVTGETTHFVVMVFLNMVSISLSLVLVGSFYYVLCFGKSSGKTKVSDVSCMEKGFDYQTLDSTKN
jgi:hypothetical protein